MPRSSHRYASPTAAQRLKVLRRIHALSEKYPRFGYRKIYWLLREEGMQVGRETVRLIRRQEGLKVVRKPIRKRRRGTSSSEVRRATHPNHVWSYDFVQDVTADSRSIRCLTVVDEFTRRSVAIEVRRSFTAHDVVMALQRLVVEYGRPAHLRSDNGPEFVAKRVQQWLKDAGIATHYIEPGHPWENGTNESFNGVFRDGCLDRELFLSVRDARVQIEAWRSVYNNERPHGALNGKTPAQFAREWHRSNPVTAAKAA